MFRLEDMQKYIILSLLCGCLSVNAQTMVPLTYRQYMDRVAEGNLEYALRNCRRPSKAEVTAAKVFNDPNSSSASLISNNENNSRASERCYSRTEQNFLFWKTGCEYLIGT